MLGEIASALRRRRSASPRPPGPSRPCRSVGTKSVEELGSQPDEPPATRRRRARAGPRESFGERGGQELAHRWTRLTTGEPCQREPDFAQLGICRASARTSPARRR